MRSFTEIKLLNIINLSHNVKSEKFFSFHKDWKKLRGQSCQSSRSELCYLEDNELKELYWLHRNNYAAPEPAGQQGRAGLGLLPHCPALAICSVLLIWCSVPWGCRTHSSGPGAVDINPWLWQGSPSPQLKHLPVLLGEQLMAAGVGFSVFIQVL